MGKTKRQIKESNKTKRSAFKDYWNSSNYMFLLIGVGVLILGYYLMTISPWDNIISLSISPIILLLGYLFIIPLSIVFSKKNRKDNVSSES